MRYLYRGITLGMFLFFFSIVYSYDDWNQATMFAVDSAALYEHQYQCDNQHNESGFTFHAGVNNSALRGVMRSYINSPEYQQACLQAAQEKKDKEKAEAEEHLEKFGVTKEELWGEGRSCGIFAGSFDDVSRQWKHKNGN